MSKKSNSKYSSEGYEIGSARSSECLIDNYAYIDASYLDRKNNSYEIEEELRREYENNIREPIVNVFDYEEPQSLTSVGQDSSLECIFNRDASGKWRTSDHNKLNEGETPFLEELNSGYCRSCCAKKSTKSNRTRNSSKDSEGARNADSVRDWDFFMCGPSEWSEQSRGRQRTKKTDLTNVPSGRRSRNTEDEKRRYVGRLLEGQYLPPPPVSSVRLRAGGPANTPPPSAPGSPYQTTPGARTQAFSPCPSSRGQKCSGNLTYNGSHAQFSGQGQQLPETDPMRGRPGTAGGRLQQIAEIPESPPSRHHLSWAMTDAESHLYAEAVQRELARLMGPEEAPSGVPAPASPAPLPPMPFPPPPPLPSAQAPGPSPQAQRPQ